ncbi:MAG TPA: TonB-dependent receptor [Bryobacteraceae bacterium]|nr:TonB-dependent receptor [Bryobacteraceae bacterium]
MLATTLGVLFLSVSLFAQGNFGRILGTVTDQTGAVLPGATVTVMDVERGLNRTLTTDAAGEYNAPNLIPGNYTVRAEAAGFKRLDRQNVLVEVGKEVRVDLTPQPGEQTQTVTVTEAVPLVDAASATLGGTLNNAAINDMPLNGRNYQNLLGLRPGVFVQPGGSPWTQSTNGSRPDETVWMLDGIINVNMFDYRPVSTMPSPFTDGATILPIDAIQEFNLEENPKAEFGWRPGAIVNVGIKSGTNTLHGSAYAFGRTGDWAARNFFNPGPVGACPTCNNQQPTELEQFGGVVGGRIIKDKLFFFAGYEGLKSFVGNALPTAVPATGSLGGNPKGSMVDAISALEARNITPNPISLKLFGCTTAPLACNGGLIQNAPSNTTSYTSGFPNTNKSDNGVSKIDYNINDKNRINGLVSIGNYLGNGEDHPVVSANFQNGDPIRTYTISGNWVYTPSSTVVNEFRFGYDKVNFALTIDDGSKFANGTDYPLNTGITSTGGFPDVKLNGGFSPLGGWRGRPTDFETPFYDFQDSVSYLKGKHALKFGVEYGHIRTNFNNHDTRGEIDFQGKQAFAGSTPLEDFFAGLPSKGSQLVGTTSRGFTWNNDAVFVQDDWRVVPKLMINLGLRYSYMSPFKEDNNLLGNFDPNSQFGLVQEGQPSVGSTLWKPIHTNFSPRLGFAYDLSGKGTTVIRGGAGQLYSMFTAQQFTGSPFNNFTGGSFTATATGGCMTSVAPGSQCPQTFGGTINAGLATFAGSQLNWNGPVFPVGAGVACTAKLPCNIVAVDPNLKYPYVVSYNLGVQHAFGNNLSLDVSYVGNHGDNLTGFLDINQCAPNPNGDCVRPYGSKFPFIKYLNETVNDSRSNYNSLQTTLTQRLSHGLSFTTGYTYAHGLDNGSLNRFGNLPQNSLDQAAEYGNSDFDIRHRLSVTATYALPGKKGFGQLLEGWKLNTIVSLSSGMPWLIYDTGNDFSTGGSGNGDFYDRWDFFGSPSDFKGTGQSIPYCSGPSNCSVVSGVSGYKSSFSAAQSATMWAQCAAVAPDPSTLASGGCYISGKSVMTPPTNGTYGTMGRNLFRDQGFKNVDFSVFKDFRYKERLGAEFRAEFFNFFNHPNVANPYGAAVGTVGGNDPSATTLFGCGCGTPDVVNGNPLVGSGSARVIQLGLKLTF